MSERVAGIEPDELPAPSAELVLWRVSLEVFISSLGRRKAERFLQLMADKLAGEESLSAVFHIRPSSEQGRVRAARRQAAAIFAAYSPIFLARLPPR
jgi:hypothetical protein